MTAFVYKKVPAEDIDRLLSALVIEGGATSPARFTADGGRVWDASIHGVTAVLMQSKSMDLTVQVVSKHGIGSFFTDDAIESMISLKLGRR